MNSETGKGTFAQNILPWVIAGAMLLVYLATLNHWVTLGNLQFVGQVGGWDWPQYNLRPLHFLITYPFRWLSGGVLPVALNLFTAVCAALTLALLARSVALLPHDRTEAQREREPSDFSLLTIPAAWLPPVLAVVACGLQLTFWENAVVATGEMFELLVFAFIVRNLLEFRLDGRECRLLCAAAAYGALMANDWLLVLFLPLFLLALFWIKGLGFLNLRFLMLMLAAGLAGMSLYLLMPLMQSQSAGAAAGFWDALRLQLAAQKNILTHLPLKQLSVLGLTSLLPLAVLGIRWASSFGDSSPMGAALGSFMFHLVHGFFLVACLWMAFDPPFSPRIFQRQFGANFSWLPLYYLAALAVGYYSGYFLLVFGRKGKRQQKNSTFRSLVSGGVWLLAIVTLGGLVYKNLPPVRTLNSPALSTLATRLTENLPARDAVVLGDDPRFFSLAQAALERSGKGRSHILLNTFALQFPLYHRRLEKEYTKSWRDHFGTNQPFAVIHSTQLIALLARLAQSHEIYYLHSSFGYYFEQFYPEQRGLVYQLKTLPTNLVSTLPPLPTDRMAANQNYWKQLDASTLSPLARSIAAQKSRAPATGGGLRRLVGLQDEPDVQLLLVANNYSCALNWWGVELQKAGQLEAAGWAFQRALDLNPDNVVAQINQGYNRNLRAGNTDPAPLTKEIAEKLRQYQNWEQTLALLGPFDEPRFTFEQGSVFFRGGLLRQAAQQFDRTKTLAPENLNAWLGLAQVHNLLQLPRQALELIRAARTHAAAALTDPAKQMQIALTQATALFVAKNPNDAEQLLQATIAAFPTDENLLNAAVQLSLTFQRYTGALAIIDRQLELSPDNLAALNNKGYACIQLQKYDAAIPSLDRLLTLQPTNSTARLNHALANLHSDHLDAAKQDYELLQRAFPKAFQVYYGLGEIAWRKNEKSAAINYYQLYLNNAPPDSEEGKFVSTRLAELKSSMR